MEYTLCGMKGNTASFSATFAGNNRAENNSHHNSQLLSPQHSEFIQLLNWLDSQSTLKPIWTESVFFFISAASVLLFHRLFIFYRPHISSQHGLVVVVEGSNGRSEEDDWLSRVWSLIHSDSTVPWMCSTRFYGYNFPRSGGTRPKIIVSCAIFSIVNTFQAQHYYHMLISGY